MKTYVKTDDLLIYISLTIFVMMMNVRSYLTNLFGSSYVTFIVFLGGLFLIGLSLAKRKLKISFNVKLFIILALFMLIPSFYKNAYFTDNRNVIGFLYYVVTIIYAIFLCLTCSDKKYFYYIMNLFLIFSIVTSIVTWISFFFPNFYFNNIVTLLPQDERGLVLLLYKNGNAYSGLTNHYSRNAFYVVLGIISLLFKILNNRKNNKKNSSFLYFLLVYLGISLFLIGKRGHILFLGVSLFITYFLYNKLSLKTIIRFIFILLLASIVIFFSIKYIPGVSNVINRIFNSGVENDISTGRFALYHKAFQLYSNNNNSPIGWGGFVKSTDYSYAGVHNDYIQIFIETGIIGFILIICSNLSIIINIIKNIKNNSSAITFVVLLFNIFYMVYALTGIPHYDVEVYMTYFVFNAFYFSNIIWNYDGVDLNEKSRNLHIKW